MSHTMQRCIAPGVGGGFAVRKPGVIHDGGHVPSAGPSRRFRGCPCSFPERQHDTMALTHMPNLWRYTHFSEFKATKNTLIAGLDWDGSPLYICVAQFEGHKIPGKFWSGGGCCVALDGKEWGVSEFGYLEKPEAKRFHWVTAENGDIPSCAVPAGSTANGEIMFSGRCMQSNSLVPGKVVPSSKAAWVSFGGREYRHADFEVLCYSD